MESTAEYEITGIRSDVTEPYQTQRSPASLTLRFACPIRLGRQSVSNGRRHLDKKRQRVKNSGQLSQEAIDRAFQNQQRRSKLAYKYQDVTITVLSGKDTGRAGVVLVTAPQAIKWKSAHWRELSLI
jgi:hypothetical protein